MAAYAAEPLAVTLGIPLHAQQLLADALDLRHRLPQTWELLDALEVPAWKARQVARTTHALPREAARWVDEQLAPRLKRCGARLIDTVTAQAIAKFQPDLHAEREERRSRSTSPCTPPPPPSTPAQRAAHHRRHPVPHRPLPVRLRQRPPRPAGDERPLGVRKVDGLSGPSAHLPVVEERERPSRNAPRRSRRRRSTCTWTSTTSTRTSSRPAGSNASARPPPPRSANGPAGPT